MDMEMLKRSSSTVSLVIAVIGLVLMLVGAHSRDLTWLWLGIDWSSFFSNVGLYVAVVVALQWFYDEYTKRELITEVTRSALSSTNVVKSGIVDFADNTTRINYQELLDSSEEIVIGFLYDTRLVNDHIEALKRRTLAGKKTSVLLISPKGTAFDFLANVIHDREYMRLQVEENLNSISEANDNPDTKDKISVRFHDSVLRYSFVCSQEGVWIKMYRNSLGRVITPGIYIRNGSPFYDFFRKDIEDLWEDSTNAEEKDGRVG